MGHQKPRKRKIFPGAARDPDGLAAWMLAFLEDLRVRNYSETTIQGREAYLSYFLAWCQERDLDRPQKVTRAILQRYQSHLFHRRKPDGSALTFHSQRNMVLALVAFFRWLTRRSVLLYNPAGELDLPRSEKRLPRHVLTVEEAEAILAVPAIEDPLGLRDRAMLEILYSTGMRRAELARLAVFDLDIARGMALIRLGKGKKDRMVPVGERAAAWCEKYLQEVRPGLVVGRDEGVLFLTALGEAYTPDGLSRLVARYVDRSGVGKRGSCHMFRHSMATAMLEGGADIRFIQEMLGHAQVSTTEIYTRVVIKKLKEIHTATHPSARLLKQDTATSSTPASAAPTEADVEDLEAALELDDPEAKD